MVTAHKPEVTPIYFFQDDIWDAQRPEDARQLEALIENGGVICMPKLDFCLMDSERQFLDPRYGDGKAKNISLRRSANGSATELRGTDATGTDALELKSMISRFAQSAQALVDRVLPHYSGHMRVGSTSFRPQRVEGRASSWRKDDSRLHVDSFPSNPTRGARLLRVFTNVNPAGVARSWRVGEPFEKFAAQFLPQISAPLPGSATLLKALRITKARRSEYDHFMLRLHDAVKADSAYQSAAPQTQIDFAPGTTWIVFSDQVLHAAMGGQHMFEQTYFLDPQYLANPQASPRGILERLLQRPLKA